MASQFIGNDIRKDLFSKTMSLSFEQTDKISTGSLVTRLTNDVTQVQNMITMAVRGLVRCVVMFAGGLYMLYRQSATFACIAACGLPFITIFVIFFLKKSSPLFTLVQEKLDKINSVMQENIAGARVIKAFVKGKDECKKFEKANDDLCNTNLKVQTLLAFLNPCVNIVLNLCTVAIIYIGGIQVHKDASITPGEIMASITYLSLILLRIIFLANIFQTFTRAIASWKRIDEILNLDNIHQEGKLNFHTNIKGEVEFKNVSFAYPDSPDQNVIENISFNVKKGETVAIIGSTGTGKSTIANLIPRFFEVTEGEIFVDGINIKEYRKKDLREKIAIVMQKTELYSRSIFENIRFGKKNATESEAKTVAVMAQADDFICSTPNGYYTQVTESGHSLSGGQKQRLSISRALLKNAEIIIFDDSSSALDLATESKLFKELNSNFKDTTKILIAQRISTVQNADKIIILENGKIDSIGVHDELMKTSLIYQDIYNSQLKRGDAIE